MKETILAAILCFGFAFCARLDNIYLPPGQRASNNIQLNFTLSRPEVASFKDLSRQSSETVIRGGIATANILSRNLEPIPILKFDSNNNGDGSYSYNYETGNSISAEEQGDAREGIRARGSFSYTSPEGEQVFVTYTADENGFAPQGSHIPTPPPVSQAILKSLQVIAATGTRSYSHQEHRGSMDQNPGGLPYSTRIPGKNAAGRGYRF